MRRPAFVVALLLGCVDAAAPGVAEQLPELVTAVTAHELCPRMRGTFAGLTASDDGGGDAPPVVGRLWLRRCEATRDGGAIDVRASGVAWRWIDRTRRTLGAKFGVSEYTILDVEVEGRVTTDAAYEPDARVVTLWLRPVAEPRVAIHVRGALEVTEKGLWAEVVGAAGGLVGQPTDERGAKALRRQAARRASGAIGDGFTVAYDLCTGQVFGSLGILRPGEVQRPSITEAPRDWIASERVRLHPHGLDVVGPFDPGGEPLHARLTVTRGTLLARLVCEGDGHALVSGYVGGETPSLPDGRAGARIAAGETATLSVAERGCPLLLVAAPAPDESGPVEHRFVVWGDGESDPMVRCRSAAADQDEAS